MMHNDTSCRALAELPVGTRASLCDHDGTAALSERLADLGFVPGTPVQVVRKAPLGDPIEVEIRGYRLCLRAEEAAAVCTRPATPAG